MGIFLRLLTVLGLLNFSALPACLGVEDWNGSVPPMRLDFGYASNDYETTFWELRPTRLAPLNTKTSVGLPGWPVIGYGYLMRARYSEFELRFLLADGKQIHTQSNFTQVSPGDWLPGADSQWDKDNIHYRVTYITVPTEAQPVDMYKISIKNTGQAATQAKLQVQLNGALTLKADENVIADRAKPLVIMDPVVPVQSIMRRTGCVDPRATAAGTWRNGSPDVDEWATHRDGWYGMPIEYLLKVDPGMKLQVFLGFDGTPEASTANWDVPIEQEYPEVRELYPAPMREVLATVEGDARKLRQSLPGTKRVVLKFSGEDIDGDGYVKISVRATPESRQPAVLAMIWAFTPDKTISEQDLINSGRKPESTKRVANEIYNGPKPAELLAKIKADAAYSIDVGDDLMWDINREWLHAGNDPTVHALQLDYNPSLAPGEERSYLLRLPAIDKPEAAPYGNVFRPFDTGEAWKPYMDNRHPENKAPYGEDIPPGIDPATYSVQGPKSKELWQRQVANVRSLSWAEAMNRLKAFWDRYTEISTKFNVPEPYIEFLYKHQLAVLKMHQVKFNPTDYFLQFTGPDWYWDIAISRDVPYMYYAYDLAGLKDDSTRLWTTMLTPRTKLPRSRYTVGQWEGKPEVEGLWVTRTGQWDSQGQILWGLANHYLLTGDHKWLDENYANIIRGAEWIVTAIELEKKRIGKPLAIGYGMLPPSTPEGGGPGHNYYASSFAILGLNSVAKLADIKGDRNQALRYRQQAKDLKASVHRAVKAGFFRYNDFAGTIPFGPEWMPGGQLLKEVDGRKISTVMPDTDFGCALVWPTESMAPFNPMMNAWCINRESLAEKKAGVFGWAYIAVDYGLSYLRRGEPDRAADWFYVYVDHASGCLDWGEGVDTKAVFTEYEPPRPGFRAGGQMPHGWASAMYVSYLRNLMLQEEGDDLHIAPGMPRKWLGQTQPVGLQNAPSQFGNVSYQLQCDPDKQTIRGKITLDSKRRPERLVVHVRAPGGRGIREVQVNHQQWTAFVGDTVLIAHPKEHTNIELKYDPD